jgi:FMN-dependent NADH-azoreductase
MKLLHIDSSISGEAAVSHQLSAAIVAEFTRSVPRLDILRRDLDIDVVPHLDSKSVLRIRPTGDAPIADRTLVEFLWADVVVIGAPMYNFTIPSQLKAWIDRILVPGVTFRYTEAGPQGLSGGKTVIVASTRGGLYSPGMPNATNDFQETYLRAVFAFVGIEHIEVVRAEGLALGPEKRDAAIESALASVNLLVPRLVPRRAA